MEEVGGLLLLRLWRRLLELKLSILLCKKCLSAFDVDMFKGLELELLLLLVEGFCFWEGLLLLLLGLLMFLAFGKCCMYLFET